MSTPTAVATEYRNLIGGRWVNAASGKTFEDRNPAHRDEVVGVFPSSGAEDVEQAYAAAAKAYESWRLTPAPKRGEILIQVGLKLKERKEAIARIMTREMGKVLVETRGDVQ